MRLTCREKYQAVVRAQQHLNPSIQMCLNLPGLLGYVSEYIPFCCCCVSKSSCLELKMLTNRQSCCHSRSANWMYSLLLGPGCLLWSALCLEVFDPCRPCTHSACFFPYSTPSPSLVLPSIPYPCGTAHTGRCQLRHEWNIREIGSL